MDEHEDYYEVLFLIPETGNRFLIQNVKIEIENKHEQTGYSSIGMYPQKTTGKTWLEITLKVYIDTMDKVKELAEQIKWGQIFLLFKNVHPNLIKGWITDITLDTDEAIINFTGNSTNKTYHDYIIEVADQLNAQQIVWEGKEPEYEPDPNEKPVKKKKVIRVLKRKLTF